MEQEGYQLKLWEDGHGDKDIIFRVTYCLDDCPFNRVYRAKSYNAKHGNVTIYLKEFTSDGSMEPAKWLVTMELESPRLEVDKYSHYILNDWLDAFSKVEELTNRTPKFRLDPMLDGIESQLGH